MNSYGLISSLLASSITLSLAGILPLAAQQSSAGPELPPHQADLPLQETVSNRMVATSDPTPESSAVSYECIDRGNTLSTIAHTARGRIELVKWQSTFFGAQWTPERRCQEVTRRLQQFSDTQNLRYISWGRMNAYKILCISGNEGTCINDGLLLTLEHKDNPVQVLRNLFDYRVPITRGSKTVIDVEKLLQRRQPLTEVSSAPDTATTEQPPSLESKFNKTRLEVAPIFRGD